MLDLILPNIIYFQTLTTLNNIEVLLKSVLTGLNARENGKVLSS